jgi:hypothetical protein
MMTMHVNDLGPDETASLVNVAGLLHHVASRGPFGEFIAGAVARRYHAALAHHGDEPRCSELWRDFLVALHTFVALHATGRSEDIAVLRAIVEENADLLPRQHAVAV